MNDTLRKLVFRMVLNTMAGNRKKTSELYEQYLRERHLYVTVEDYVNYKANFQANKFMGE